MQNREIYQDQEGNLYYVEYDINNNPYKVYCDEYGNPVNMDTYEEEQFFNTNNDEYIYNKNHQKIYNKEPFENDIYTNYQEEPKEKKSKWWLWLLILPLFFGSLATAGYLGYEHYTKKDEATIETSDYVLKFVVVGNDGNGKPNIDIEKIPSISHIEENKREIEEFLRNPEIIFDKNEKLKNGDKVQVELKLNEYTAKKYKLRISGKVKQTYTVSGLTEKKEEKEVKKEDRKEDKSTISKENNKSFNEEKNKKEIEQKVAIFLDNFREDVGNATYTKDASYIDKYFYSKQNELYIKLKEAYEVLAKEQQVLEYKSKSFDIEKVTINNNRYVASVHFITDVYYKDGTVTEVNKKRDYLIVEKDGRLYLENMTNL